MTKKQLISSLAVSAVLLSAYATKADEVVAPEQPTPTVPVTPEAPVVIPEQPAQPSQPEVPVQPESPKQSEPTVETEKPKEGKKEPETPVVNDGVPVGTDVPVVKDDKKDDIFLPLLTINSEIEEGIKETKKTVLLELYLNKFDDMTEAFDELKAMIGDSYGNYLFNRLLTILDHFPPEEMYVSMMSDVLKKVIQKGEFKTLFAIYQLHFRLIEQLSPQALYVLGHYTDLPCFTKELGVKQLNVETGHMVLQGDWGLDVVRAASLDDLVASVVTELIDNHYLIAVFGDDGKYRPTLTKSGQLLYEYLR